MKDKELKLKEIETSLTLGMFVYYYNRYTEGYRGGNVKGVGVMKDKELKLKETEVSLTLGGVREGHFQGRGKGIVLLRIFGQGWNWST